MELNLNLNIKTFLKFTAIVFLIAYVSIDVVMKIKSYYEVTVYKSGYQQAVYELLTTLEKNKECKPLDISLQDKKISIIQTSCVSGAEQTPQVQPTVTQPTPVNNNK